MEQWLARGAHDPKVASSNPASNIHKTIKKIIFVFYINYFDRFVIEKIMHEQILKLLII
jgi:hypothetical protein